MVCQVKKQRAETNSKDRTFREEREKNKKDTARAVRPFCSKRVFLSPLLHPARMSSDVATAASSVPSEGGAAAAAQPETLHDASKLQIVTAKDKNTMGFAAASCGAEFIRRAIRDRGQANIIVATGASQFEVLASLVQATGVEWDKCHFFHLDEYIGISPSHGTCFNIFVAPLCPTFVSAGLPTCLPARSTHNRLLGFS